MFFSALLLGLGAVGRLVTASPFQPHPHGDAKLGAVASEAAVCTEIGIDILKAGGNAADSVSWRFRLNWYISLTQA